MQGLAGLAVPAAFASAGLLSSGSHATTVTVRPGDTLSGIAQQVYGQADQWPELFAANRRLVPDANDIYPGEVLAVPGYVPRHAAPAPRPAVTVVRQEAAVTPGGTLGCTGLAQLWVQAGGAQGEALTAASVAMAESGGDQYALSPTDDYGYWQINAAHGPAEATFSALGNARAAIAISADGSDWDAWTTYATGAYAGRC